VAIGCKLFVFVASGKVESKLSLTTSPLKKIRETLGGDLYFIPPARSGSRGYAVTPIIDDSESLEAVASPAAIQAETE